MNDRLDIIAQNAIDEATQDLEEKTEFVRLWDDEWEQWHILEDAEATVELPAEAVFAFRLAGKVWELAQATLVAAVEALEAGFSVEARDHGWVHEVFRGDLTLAQLEARVAGCKHPSETITLFEATGSRRCSTCAQWLPRAK